MIGGEELLAAAEGAVRKAVGLGADQAEVFATGVREIEVELQKDDVRTAGTAEEATFGIRVARGGSMGFATVNGPEGLADACAEALAMAAVSPPDDRNGLRDPDRPAPLDEGPDPRIHQADVADLVLVAERMIGRVSELDPRVRIDSGSVGASVGAKAIATSTGIRLHEPFSSAAASLFGMAVDGDEVGSFDHDGQMVSRWDRFETEVDALARRFVVKTTGALGATRGESFRGPVVLAPEVVGSFVIGNLMSVLSAKAVRTGRSPLAERAGEQVASPLLTLVEDARRAGGSASTGFDREGTTTRRFPVLENGVLGGFLYDVYEARAAGAEPTGHARGGAAGLPRIGPSNMVLERGDTTMARLCTEPPRSVVVSRFSGSTNPVTGDFSGVVKGGFLIRDSGRTAIKETMIAGNLYELIQSVSGVSSEVRDVYGRLTVPALRIEDVSVTAG